MQSRIQLKHTLKRMLFNYFSLCTVLFNHLPRTLHPSTHWCVLLCAVCCLCVEHLEYLLCLCQRHTLQNQFFFCVSVRALLLCCNCTEFCFSSATNGRLSFLLCMVAALWTVCVLYLYYKRCSKTAELFITMVERMEGVLCCLFTDN